MPSGSLSSTMIPVAVPVPTFVTNNSNSMISPIRAFVSSVKSRNGGVVRLAPVFMILISGFINGGVPVINGGVPVGGGVPVVIIGGVPVGGGVPVVIIGGVPVGGGVPTKVKAIQTGPILPVRGAIASPECVWMTST